jgi:hypothetical protein
MQNPSLTQNTETKLLSSYKNAVATMATVIALLQHSDFLIGFNDPCWLRHIERQPRHFEPVLARGAT